MTDERDDHANDHEDCDPDKCFTKKLRYWRERKQAPLVVPDSFKAVHR